MKYTLALITALTASSAMAEGIGISESFALLGTLNDEGYSLTNNSNDNFSTWTQADTRTEIIIHSDGNVYQSKHCACGESGQHTTNVDTLVDVISGSLAVQNGGK